MYISYEEYVNYGGTLDRPTFSKNLPKVEKLLDFMTACRVQKMQEVPEIVKRCLTDLVEAENVYASTIITISSNAKDGKGATILSSFSTDGYQESYSVGAMGTGDYIMSIRKNVDNVEKRLIKDYLEYEYDDNNVKLLYRGVG